MSDMPALPVARATALRIQGNDHRPGLTSPTPTHPGETGPASFALENLAGRLTELSAFGNRATLTLTSSLILEAQMKGEPAAWIACGESSFYPPDFARAGIDLEALPVVRVKDGQAGARAADKLIRSGAFGLVVLDLVGTPARSTIPPPLQSRLLALASKHAAAMVFLTEKKPDAPSLGSLVSLRAQAKRRRIQEGRYACDVEVVKDKRHGPGRSRPELCPSSWPDSWNGPAGLH